MNLGREKSAEVHPLVNKTQLPKRVNDLNKDELTNKRRLSPLCEANHLPFEIWLFPTRIKDLPEPTK
jgi:hypothetical protein